MRMISENHASSHTRKSHCDRLVHEVTFREKCDALLIRDDINSGVDTHVCPTVIEFCKRSHFREICDALLMRDNINSDIDTHVRPTVIDLCLRSLFREKCDALLMRDNWFPSGV